MRSSSASSSRTLAPAAARASAPSLWVSRLRSASGSHWSSWPPWFSFGSGLESLRISHTAAFSTSGVEGEFTQSGLSARFGLLWRLQFCRMARCWGPDLARPVGGPGPGAVRLGQNRDVHGCLGGKAVGLFLGVRPREVRPEGFGQNRKAHGFLGAGAVRSVPGGCPQRSCASPAGP